MTTALTPVPAQYPLSVPGVQLGPVGIRLPASLAYDEWAAIVAYLPRIGDSAKWALGDAILFGEGRYGETYTQALAATGYEYGTLANRVYVARRFEISRRRENLRWWIYQDIAAFDIERQESLMDWAEVNQPTRTELRVHISEANRGDVRAVPHEPPHVLTVDVPASMTVPEAARLVNVAASYCEPTRDRIVETLDALTEIPATDGGGFRCPHCGKEIGEHR